ncbi:unnamed protein product, partial [Didymodactylos carnosus]
MYNQPNGYSTDFGGGGGVLPNNQIIQQNEQEGEQLLEEDEFGRTEEEFDEDMQRELADDAPWKKIQQNTFTRWANEHLKLVNRHVDDLQTDFSDGLNLIALIEVLSQKKLPKHNRRPNFRSQKLENVSVVLDFLENTERIRLVNIDATHIVDGKLKLILGLIWTLILHYSISLPMWEFEQPDGQNQGRDATPKQKLMNWVQGKLPPELPITNFTSDWNDGRAIGALVDACAPGLYPDWADRDPRNALANAKEAMDLAEQWLGIPQLIQPQEMINPKVDEQSMMTYLSQYPSAKLKPGAPVKPKTNSARVRCYGKGNNVDAPAKFHVETFAAGKGNVDVIVINPKGQKEKCDIEFRNDKNQTYDCTYYPTMEGQYKVIVKFAGQEVPKSPFSPYIEGKSGDASQCKVHGPGLEPTGVMVDKPTWFEVDATNAGNGLVEVVLIDPRGRQDVVPISVKPLGNGKFRCEYVAREPGLHSVNIFFAGKPIPQSPYGVNVSSSSSISSSLSSVVLEHNYQSVPISSLDLSIKPKWNYDSGYGDLFDKQNPQSFVCGGTPHPVRHTDHLGRHHAIKDHSLTPRSELQSPFEPIRVVTMTPIVPLDITEHKNTNFGFEQEKESTLTNSDRQNIVSENDSEHTYNDSLNSEKSFVSNRNSSYAPTTLSVNSQYYIVDKASDAKKCRAFGRGIQPKGVRTGDVAEFRVVTKDAGEGAMKATVIGPDNNEIPCRVTKANNTTYECGYVPNRVGPHTVNITYGGAHIPKSPFPVYVGPYKDSRIRAYGPGLEGGVVGFPADFMVETNGETGSLGFSIEGPSQARIECHDNGDGSAKVRYWPTIPGEYAIHILCNDEDIPNSPFMAWIEPPGNFDPTKVKAFGPGIEPSGQIIGKPTEFTVDTHSAGEAPLRVQAIDQEYQPVDVQVMNNGNGTFKCKYTPRHPIRHSIMVDYGGVAIPNSPFKVWPTEPSNPSKVKVYGPGVERGVKMNIPTHFTVDCKEAGPGDISIALTDTRNQDVPFTIDDNQDGTFTISYTPKLPGLHCISVLFGESEIPISPIKVNVEPSIDVDKIRVEGLDTIPIVGQPAQLTLNTQAAGPLPPNAVKGRIKNPSGNFQDAIVTPAHNGYNLRFNVPEPGQYVVEPEVCSLPLHPIILTAVEPLDPSKVRAFGPGLSQGTVNKPADFIVDTKNAGNGQLGVTVEGPSESKIDYQDNNDGSCRVTYHPTVAGNYNINILYEGKHIPGSPFRAAVRPDLDTRGILCYGPGLDKKVDDNDDRYSRASTATNHNYRHSSSHDHERKSFISSGSTLSSLIGHTPLDPYTSSKSLNSGVFLESPTEFTVDARSVTGSGTGKVECLLTSPSGRVVRCPVKNIGDGTYQVQYAPYEAGMHQLDVTYENIPVPGSPFRISAIPGCDPTRVRAYGPGLENATTNEATTFTIETKGAGQGSLGLAIEGPSEAKMICRDNQDGTCIMEYLPVCSPFRVNVRDRLDANKVNVKMPQTMRANSQQEILIDGQAAGPGSPTVDITDVH